MYELLDKVMSAIKALAYGEVSKLQSQSIPLKMMLTRMRGVLLKLQYHFNESVSENTKPVVILLGTARGFCGDINRQILHALDREVWLHHADILVVGDRLSQLMEDRAVVHRFSGAAVSEEIEPLVEQLVDVLLQNKTEVLLGHTVIMYFEEDSNQVQFMPLLFGSKELDYSSANKLANAKTTTDFMTYEDKTELLRRFIPVYIFSVLQYCLKTALLSENKRRLTHMEDATRHLSEKTQTLSIQSNQLRQEEITEEIEALLFNEMAEIDQSCY